MPGGKENEMGTGSDGGASGTRGEDTVMEHSGRVESNDPSKFEVKADDGGTFLVDRKVVVDAEERGNNFKVESWVAPTTPRGSSNVLSLKELDEHEGGTDGGEAAEQGDQATKSA